MRERLAAKGQQSHIGVALRIGNPLDAVDLGPKISRPELEKIEAMAAEAVRGGAELLTGGHRLEGDAFAKGHWFEPTVMMAPSNTAPIMQQEIFGPVVPVMRVAGFDEALRLANESEFGLSAYLFTGSLSRVMRFNSESAFGELYINRTCGEMVQGFHSGWKNSGLGGEDGKYGFDAYLRKKTAYVAA
ncbi:aldehyde dehydrogenase family protein [Mesorhizobium sp. NZP2077]|uniref:aldehyde dehydrogenase family protein n=1 Tax=Mesorhizobium sp. NZP2077 TaxID=2483404 RepID=UPI001FEEF7D5|nr:aldehyde dehydrogenase family protein [Mesorhizobium sp. NZP2077]